MTTGKPPVRLDLDWQRELVFAGTGGGAELTLDSDGEAGVSPMQALAFAVTGCMAMDVAHILQRGRHRFTAIRAEFSGERAQADPHRFTSITLRFRITGPVPADAVQRAIDLSRDKYCSVWHSMRQDIGLAVEFTLSP